MKNKPGKTVKTGFGDDSALPVIDIKLCNRCGLCARVCKSDNIVMIEGKPVVDINRGLGCVACGQCMAVCPKGAVIVTGRRLAREHAVTLPPRAKRAGADALEWLLLARRSTREFSDRPIDKKTIDRLLSMSATAPIGIPPSDVGVVVINDSAHVQKFAADMIEAFKKWQALSNPVAMAVMRLFLKKDIIAMMKDLVLPVTAEIIEARKQKSDLLLYNAPCLILFHYHMNDPIDATIAASFATIAAESLGLGTCMIGTVPPALQNDKKLKTKWGIPQNRYIFIAMILGYPAFKYTKGIRRSFESVRYL